MPPVQPSVQPPIQTKLWQFYRDDLVQLSFDPASIARAVRLASQVPGAHVDEANGNVCGSLHALQACLLLAGQDPSFQLREDAFTLPHNSLPTYQGRAVGWMNANLEQGVLNNDDVGLGKTVETIASVGGMASYPKLVLCPASLKGQWKSEIEKWSAQFNFAPPPRVHILYPASDKRSQKPIEAPPNWIVAFYLDTERALEIIGEQSYFLIVDEIHNIRGYKSQRLKSVQNAATFAQGRVGLTASLLVNDVRGLFTMVNLIQPGAWGSFPHFAKRYGGAVDGTYGLELPKRAEGVESFMNLEELKPRLSTMSFRRTREQVYKELPFNTRFQTIWLDPPPGARTSLMGCAKDLATVAAHFRAIAEWKVPAIAESILNDMAGNTPSLTFTWLKSQAAAIAQAAHGALCITGEQSANTRLTKIQDYLAKCRVMGTTPAVVATMDSLGTGANLQWAKVVNLAALQYEPDQLHQAIGRAARMGQSGTVLVRVFGCKQTLDEHQVSILTSKLKDQAELQGEEHSKQQLQEALQPRNVKDVIAAMLERYKNDV